MPPSHPFSAEFLSREWPLLREACSFSCNREKIVAYAADVRDLESLFRLAEEHGVIAHLAVALGDTSRRLFPGEFLEKLLTRRRLQSVFALAMTAELFRILDILRSAGIDAVVVKGPVLSVRAYNDPGMRRYADVDLVVRHSDIARAVEILTTANYRSKVPRQAIHSGKVPGEYVFRCAGDQLLFEFHTERTLRYFPRGLPIEDFFARKTAVFVDGRDVPALSAEDEFVLICIHGAKHFWERLQLISDVAAIVRRAGLDWPRVRIAAQEAGASRIVHLALALAQNILRAPVPTPLQLDVGADKSCQRIAIRAETWLPYAGYITPAFAERALFRFQMRGGWFSGASYLARLSVSTTEEDWKQDPSGSRIGEILRRPFRLARKYRRNPD